MRYTPDMENGTKVYHSVYGEGTVQVYTPIDSRVRVYFKTPGSIKDVYRGTLDVVSDHHVSQSNTRIENQVIELFWDLAQKDSLDERERLLLAAVNTFLG